MIERCYKEMSFRMNKLELRDLRQSNGLPVDAYSYGDASSIMTTEGPSTTSTLPEPASNPSKENILCDFAETLRKSWVYLRNNALDSSRCSVHSKDHCSMTWSCLSGLSWAEVSNISVIELPVMLDEVYNPLRSLQTWSNNHIEPNLHHPDLFGPVLPMKGSHVSSPNGLDLARDGLYSLPCIPNRRHPNTRHRDIKNTSREQLGESFRTPRLKSGGSVGRPMTGMLELERSRARLERTFVGYECAVCKEPLEHIRFRFSCGHVSHDACFYQYLGDFDAQHCPACNLPLLYTILKGKLLDIGTIKFLFR